MITSSKKLKDDYNITIGCLPDCLDSLEKIQIEDTEVFFSFSDYEPLQSLTSEYEYHWLPIVENGKWGLDVFEIFWDKLEENFGKNIYIHCTAGVNRSRCLVYSFLKFRLKLSDEKIMEYFPVHKNLGGDYRFVDRLFTLNQREGHIPSNEKLEKLSMRMLNDSRIGD